MLGSNKLQTGYLQTLGEKLEVFWFSKPRRKVVRLGFPNRSEVDLFKPAKCHLFVSSDCAAP